MSDAAQQIARRTGFAMMWPLVVGLPIALFTGGIDIPIFMSVGALWLIVAVFLIVGPESISEITIWKASIKTDAKAARQARNEAEAIRDELRDVSRLNIENVFVLNSMLAGVYTRYGNAPLPIAFEHVVKNLEELTPLVSDDPEFVKAWQARMRDVVKAG